MTNKEIWNAFVRDHAPRSGAFLQSWEWGEFQKAAGKKVRRVVAADESGPAASAQLIEQAIPIWGRYLLCPRGPLFRPGTNPMPLLSAVANKIGALFVRFEPSVVVPLKKTIEVSPAHTLITSLAPTEEQLLAAMHEKTRYNARLAERKGVTVEIGGASLDEVWPLFVATASRGQFHLHPKPYYVAMLAASPAFLAVARFEGTVVAANIMIDWNGTRTYLHGASSNEHRGVMGPYLLHWELMCDAKRKDMEAYDWWGVAPDGASDAHPWSGITRFKLGFGGARVDLPGTFDMTMRPFSYRLYGLLRALRRASRVS